MNMNKNILYLIIGILSAVILLGAVNPQGRTIKEAELEFAWKGMLTKSLLDSYMILEDEDGNDHAYFVFDGESLTYKIISKYVFENDIPDLTDNMIVNMHKNHINSENKDYIQTLRIQWEKETKSSGNPINIEQLKNRLMYEYMTLRDAYDLNKKKSIPVQPELRDNILKILTEIEKICIATGNNKTLKWVREDKVMFTSNPKGE